MRSTCLCVAIVILFNLPAPASSVANDLGRPNVIYILADDLGYGDVQALNPTRGKIPTPRLDRLISEGMYFTDAHSGSAVCTPTRYGLLTGRYCWRSHLRKGVLDGFSPPLIAPDRLTVASMLKSEGYATACIGKWHLGMNLQKNHELQTPIAGSPVTNGFDSFYGISASLDMPPYVFIENDRLTKPLTTEKAFHRRGPAAADFEAIDVLPRLTQKACEFLAVRRGLDQPFFLYLPLTSPHTPIVPTAAWEGKSALGLYGDFVMATDAAIGDVLTALEASGHAENTIVIVTSDNGCSPAAKTDALEAKGHFASERARGYKADIWDGGHRVPFLVRWPGKIKPGGKSDQTVCLTDLMGTCADILHITLPPTAGEDSVSMLPVFLGTDTEPLREATVHHSISGAFAIRRGPWKLELCKGSGGWSSGGGPEEIQLYNMRADPGETKNLFQEHPEIVRELTELLQRYVNNGRSTPGPKQANDRDVVIVVPPKGGGTGETKKKDQ